jgi:hypothetical protein
MAEQGGHVSGAGLLGRDNYGQHGMTKGGADRGWAMPREERYVQRGRRARDGPLLPDVDDLEVGLC